MSEYSLQGGCSCGRNQYEIVLPSPDDAKSTTQVLLCEAAEIRRSQGSPSPVLLRVPLPWLQSTTYAYTKDERPADIRRVFSPHSEPQSKRNFCGFCGTLLTYWTEGHPGEADFICVNIGSLEHSSMTMLDDFGLFPKADWDVDDDDTGGEAAGFGTIAQPAALAEHRLVRNEPWYEKMIRTGSIGRLKRQKGVQKSHDGHNLVEWEIVEVETTGDAETSKKKQMTAAAPSDEKHDMQE